LLLNLLLYWLFGFHGPAIASVIVSILTSVVICKLSAKALETDFSHLVHKKELALVVMQLLVTAIPALLLKYFLRFLAFPPVAILIAVGGAYVGTVFLLNRKRLLQLFRSINQYK
jgi:O-antigen/teichoic acid export membrane protein